MLSNKMTFSLMSLITILALAFVVTPAMAQDFDVKLDMADDKSSADGLQVDHPGTSLVIMLKSDEPIILAAAKVFVVTYDMKGKILAIPTATVAETTASKTATVTIPVTADTAKVNIKIAEGIASSDPLSTKKTKKVDVNIGLLQPDDAAGPTVYSIRRADNPLLPVTAATVQVIVTLSEMPKEFKKGNLSISDNATIADPAALDPVAEDTLLRQIVTPTIDDDPPIMRGLYTPW